jgi:hypothetical protein
MREESVFDKLVAGLSSAERREMLARIEQAVGDLEMPEEVVEPVEEFDLDETYSQMGLLRRLIVMLVSFFTGRNRLSIVESYLLRDLRKRVAGSMPHGFDTTHDQMKPAAVEDFRELARCARYFAGILGRVMGRERRGFIAFLVGLHSPSIQHRLLEQTDPFSIAEATPDVNEFEVKRRSLSALESILAGTPNEVRQRVYRDVRALHHMMALSAFQYDRFIAAFLPVAGGEAVPVPVARLAEDLAKLASLFDGLRTGPSARLFEALSIYKEQDQLMGQEADVEALVQESAELASEAYGGIHAFGKRYPLTDLVRIAMNTVHFRPTPLPGGEDWFAQWKSFWMDRLDQLNRRFAFERRLAELQREASATLGMGEIERFPGYPPSGLDEPGRHGISMGLLRTALLDVYKKEIHLPLGTLHRDGEFYKSDNRSELDAAMEALERIQTDVANLEIRMRPTGDLGMAWQQTTGDGVAPDVAEDRQGSLARQIDSDSSALLQRAIEAFGKLGKLLQGVLFGSIGGQYDTISNLGELGGRDPQAFIRSLEKAHVRCKNIAKVISQLHGAEAFQGR